MEWFFQNLIAGAVVAALGAWIVRKFKLGAGRASTRVLGLFAATVVVAFVIGDGTDGISAKSLSWAAGGLVVFLVWLGAFVRPYPNWSPPVGNPYAVVQEEVSTEEGPPRDRAGLPPS